MEEYLAENGDYQRGFNEGYTIEAHLPEMGEKLAHALGGSVRSEGFKDGREQLMVGQKRERTPSWLRKDRLSSLDKGHDPVKDKGKEKDDLEHER